MRTFGYRTRVHSEEGKSYEVVASFQDNMGSLPAVWLTGKLIERWDPAYIILVGIAGSFHKSVKLGDVIVSQQIFHYEPGKDTEAGIEYRPEGYPCSPVLIRQAQALAMDGNAFAMWRTEAKRSAGNKAEKITRGTTRAERMYAGISRMSQIFISVRWPPATR